MGKIDIKNISIIGFGVSSAYSSIWLNQQNIKHDFFIDKNHFSPLNAAPVSNPIISGTSLNIEREIFDQSFFDNLIYIKGYSFYFHKKNYEPTLQVHGNYILPAYAMDSRLKWNALLSKIKTLKFVNVEQRDSAQLESEIKKDGIKLLGGGKNYSINFNSIKSIIPFTEPSRRIIFFNVNIGDQKITKYQRASTFYIKDSGEFLIYPFMHKNNFNALNITIEIIKGSPIDIFNSSTDYSLLFEKAKILIKEVSPEIYYDIKEGILLDDATIYEGILPHYKNPINSFSNLNKVFGIGDSVCLNDPITGQGYNTSIKMSKIFNDFYMNFIRSENPDLLLELYQNELIHLITILYDFNINLTKGNNNTMLLPLMELASKNTKLANFLGSTFDDVKLLYPWYNDKNKTEDLMKKYQKQ